MILSPSSHSASEPRHRHVSTLVCRQMLQGICISTFLIVGSVSKLHPRLVSGFRVSFVCDRRSDREGEGNSGFGSDRR